MTESNPYATPAADLASPSNVADHFVLHDPRRVSLGRGASWLAEGFGYFKDSPGAWILTCIVGFVILIVLAILPIVNLLTSLFSYVWLGGLMLGLKAQHDGERFQVAYLFAGFKNKFGTLVLLSLLVFLAAIGIGLAIVGSAYLQLMGIGGNPEDLGDDFIPIMLRSLIALAVMIPLFMAIWFAPALIVLHDVPIIQSMKMSFFACLKNFLPFLLYGALGLVLLLVASIPLGLGLLVAGPMCFGSIFSSYKDIFVDDN